MKNKLLSVFGLIIVAFILTGCTQKNTSTTTETGEDTIKSSLLDLVKSGKNLKCTFSTSNSNGSSSGITYVSGTKSSSIFTSKTTEGTETVSNTIMDGDWIYIWGEGVSQGTKMKISDLQTQDSTKGNSQTNAVQNPIDYKCSTWIVDNSKFVPPSDIQFVDFSETIKQTQNQLKQYCTTCDQAGDATAVAECKKNLGCE